MFMKSAAMQALRIQINMIMEGADTMKMKKLLSLVLVLALALTAFSAFAEDAAEADWIEADFSDHADIRYELAGITPAKP